MTVSTARRIGALVTASVLLAACSSKAPQDEPSAAAPSTPASSTTSATLSIPTIPGASPELAKIVAQAYDDQKSGARVPSDATAKIGSWKGEKVAVVTAGKDATLAATSDSGKKWSYVGGWYPSLDVKDDLGGVQHVAVIGSDARPGQNVAASRADTMQLLGVDGSGGGGVLGLARDLWVPIPGHGQGKLNSALVFAGPQGQKQAIQSVTGIPVKGYLLTGFAGFTSLVNELGGIPISLPASVTTSRGTVPGGGAQLTGDQALALARERKKLPDGDFGRSNNQGLLVLAAAIKARAQGVGQLPKSLSVVDRYVESDLSAAQMLRFAAAFYRLNPSKVGHAVAKGGFGWSGDGQSIVLLDQASKNAMKRFASGRL